MGTDTTGVGTDITPQLEALRNKACELRLRRYAFARDILAAEGVRKAQEDYRAAAQRAKVSGRALVTMLGGGIFVGFDNHVQAYEPQADFEGAYKPTAIEEYIDEMLDWLGMNLEEVRVRMLADQNRCDDAFAVYRKAVEVAYMSRDTEYRQLLEEIADVNRQIFGVLANWYNDMRGLK